MLGLATAIFVIAFLLIVLRAVGEATPHPFTVHDLLAMERISGVDASPDGQRIAFTLRKTDLDANKGRNDIWLVNTDGSGLRRLTSHAAGSSTPRWAPDGASIYFLSGRSDASQVWRIPVDGGEAEQVTDLPLDVGDFKIAPDGRHLAVAVEVFPDAATLEETKQRLDAEKERQSSGRLYDRIFVRHWDTWKDGRRSHVFVVPVEGGAAVDIMQGMDADAPSKPFGGAEEFTFTPDSAAVVFAARDQGPAEPWSTHFNLYVAPIDGSAPPRIIVDGQGAMVTGPTFSPDGKTLGYLAMKRAGYEADRLRIALLNWPDGQPKILTEDWDHSAGGITWARDSATIFTTADDTGQHPPFAINVADGDVTTLYGIGKVSDVVATADRVIFGLRHFQSPVELYSVELDGNDPRPITKINAARCAAARSRVGTTRRSTPGPSSRSISIRAASTPSRSSSTAGRRARSATTSTTAGTRRPTPAPATPWS
jgi:dipeptidyl aminopeptidase/acylaminoacyl peptidase